MDMIDFRQETFAHEPPAIVSRLDEGTTALSSNTFPSRFVAEAHSASKQLGGTFKSSLLNRWATDAGFLIGEGPVMQNLLALDIGKFSGFVWNNTDFGHRTEVNEVDVGLSYTLLDREVGPGRLRFSVGAQSWFYPTDTLGAKSRFDILGTATLTWSGPITIGLDYKHLFPGQSTDFAGELAVIKLSRALPVYKFESGSSLTLNFESQLPLRESFFVKDGFSIPCVRAGGSLRWEDSKGHWAVEVMARYQHGLNATTASQPVYGFSLQRSW